MIQTDVCVLGAGPGGVAASLQLAKLGIPNIVVDKAVFPRDKICGDAVSGKVVWLFNQIEPAIFKDFTTRNDLKANFWGVKFIYPNKTEMQVDYHDEGTTVEELPFLKPSGFISKRENFDNFLVNFLKKEPLIDLKENTPITNIERISDGFILSTPDNLTQIKAKLVIAADGAQSKFARQIGHIKKEARHYSGAIRAYYKNVKGFDDFNHIELHYLKEFLPGYLWVFPLPNGEANVGAGIRTDLIKKNNTNLKKDMLHILKEHPRFKERFKDAELVGNIRGFGLPLGSKKRKISGNNYMLIGDAASLIDPLSGEGIGNAAISGRFAALQAAKAIQENDFSEAFLGEYDKAVYDKLWKELKISSQLQNAFQYGKVITFFAKRLSKNKQFLEILSAMFKDVDLRKKLRNPFFYFKLLFNR
ncbi:MAG: NAD(P)/FAD-dependent oxidoreductase [Saprospiraceae bacterium]